MSWEEDVIRATEDCGHIPSKYDELRNDLTCFIAVSRNLKELRFLLEMAGHRCRMDEDGSSWSVIPRGAGKPVRLSRLGKRFSKEAVLAKLGEKREEDGP